MHINIVISFFKGELHMGKNNDIDEIEVGEDYTKYGEFISSYFAWISLPKQKERVKELENISNNKKKRK